MKHHRFFLVLALGLSAIFWTLGAVFIIGWVRQAGTTSWPSTPGEVLSSEVKPGRGSKGGRTYKPLISYRYTLNGVTHTSDTITLASTISESKRAYAGGTVARFPAGKQVTVYYNPSDPSEAVLTTGIGNREWQGLAFLSPFLFAPLVGWSLLIGSVRERGPGHVGTVPVIAPALSHLSPGTTVIRDYAFGPWAGALTVLMVGVVATLLVVMLGFSGSGARDALLIGWGVTALLAGTAWAARARWLASGRRDAVIDLDRGVFAFPRGRRATAPTVALERIKGTRLKQDSDTSTNRQRHWRVHLEIVGYDATRAVADIRRKEDAEVFNGWLRAKLALPPAAAEPLRTEPDA